MNIEQYLPTALRKSYTRKIAAVALGILIVVALVGLYSQTQVSAEVTQQQEQSLQGNAQLEADSLNQWIDTQQRATRSLSEHQGLATGSPDEARETLNDKLDQLPQGVVALHYLNYTSQEIAASTEPAVEDGSITDTSIVWPQEQSFSELSFDDPQGVTQSWIYRSESGATSIALLSPVPGTDYATVMILETAERAEAFRSSIEGTETVAIGSTTGDLLFGDDEDALLSAYDRPGSDKILERISETDSGTVSTSDSLVAFAAVGGDSNWVLIKRAPKSTALSTQRQARNNVIALSLSALLGLFVLGFVVSRGPVRSLRELSTQATAVSNGNLDEPITDEGRIDEVGQARSGFREIRGYLETVADQADAISDQRFDAPVLDEDVPGRLGNSLDQMQADTQQFISDLEATREEAEQSREEAEQLLEELERQADEFGTVLRRVADGDLTARLDADTDNDAMYEIATLVNEMLAEIESTMAEIQTFSHEVAAGSQQASASAQEAKRASEQISESIQEIASGADDQREQLAQISNEMNTLSATIEEVASTAQTVANTSEKTESVASNGEQTAKQAISKMNNVEETMRDTVDNVEELDTLIAEIDEIVELIADIADQTNMLALNANIEAARAGGDGTDGEGFGVVANEVKQLAGETRESAEEVAQLVETVQEQTSVTVTEIKNAEEQVQDTTHAVEETVTAFTDVAENIETTNNGVQEISEAMDDQAASSEEVVSMADGAAEISQSTAAESETVSASAEEQASSMSEVSHSVESLAEQANKLQQRLERFETDSTGSEL